MKRDLSFSIVVPTYNRVEFILLAVRSVLNQTYANFELIIVDDGSTDKTSEVIATITDPRVRYVKIENSERGKARNTGVALAKGDYVTFLDSDDQLYADCLESANNGLFKYNYTPFYHQAYEVRSYLKEKVRFVHEYNSRSVKFLVKGNPLSCLGVFIRRAEALQFPFVEDRRLSGSEDWELWIRLAANFGLKRDDKICACLVLHDDRSIYDIDEKKIVLRKNLAMEYSFRDPEVVRKFGRQKNKMFAYSDTYNSLHLALAGKTGRSFFYLLKAFKRYPFSVFERRTLAIFKYYFLYLFKMI